MSLHLRRSGPLGLAVLNVLHCEMRSKSFHDFASRVAAFGTEELDLAALVVDQAPGAPSRFGRLVDLQLCVEVVEGALAKVRLKSGVRQLHEPTVPDGILTGARP